MISPERLDAMQRSAEHGFGNGDCVEQLELIRAYRVVLALRERLPETLQRIDEALGLTAPEPATLVDPVILDEEVEGT